ncbi:hypothetical protein [Streptomyces cinereoruber]|uniref:hypothetical protein n=1 Tax=Streptomyces cinereoruber TaxID=67260 RepID=UPI00362B017E
MPTHTPEPCYSGCTRYEEYEQAWYIWRAQQRDEQLNPEEHAARFEVIEARIRGLARVKE